MVSRKKSRVSVQTLSADSKHALDPTIKNTFPYLLCNSNTGSRILFHQKWSGLQHIPSNTSKSLALHDSKQGTYLYSWE